MYENIITPNLPYLSQFWTPNHSPFELHPFIKKIFEFDSIRIIRKGLR